MEEAEDMESYDYLLINEDLETCVEELHQIVRCEHQRTGVNLEMMSRIKNDLKRFVEGE